MDNIVGGPNWEELLGSEFSQRAANSDFARMQKEIYLRFENTFMLYRRASVNAVLIPAVSPHA